MADARGQTAILVRPLQRQAAYLPVLEAMRRFTAQRDDSSVDELWLVEHAPVFTQGLAGRDEHVLDPGEIPVVRTERGGQVTYHGPGQVVAYLMLDLRRRGLGPRDLVCRIESAVIEVLAAHGVQAVRRSGAPGVYLGADEPLPGAKIASLGIKISRGCSYHGVALNGDMDLSPFERIHPCGYAGQAVTDLRRAGGQPVDLPALADEFARALARSLESPCA